jgi:PAS domain S-box-containing protein
MGPLSDEPDRLRAALAREYAAALAGFVAGGGELALTRGYMLGRKAAQDGIGVLDIAMVHHEALAGLAPAVEADRARQLELAAQFLVESLSPFEMTLRAYQDNARLLGLSETLAAQNSEIDRSREQLRTILDATTAIIYLKDSEGRYLFANRAFQEIFELRRDEVIGRTDQEVLPPAVAEALRAVDRRVLEGLTPQELEETIPEADGAHTFLSLKFPLLDESGHAYGICCVATDITERKRQAEALRRAIAAAESANRELESFSYSVAHDLRAPLRSIAGFGQALLEDFGDRLDAKGQRYLGYVRESAKHMAQLIDDLLALSRVARGDLARGRVDLSATCRKVAERLQASEPGRRVEFDIQDGVVTEGDARLLRAVLENLVGNAWKFTGKLAQATISFGARTDETPPVYFVRDDGAGFDMAYADKLFGVFQRLHKNSEYEGTGIGLATVQRIIRRHGGRVWAEGEVGRGATFYFTLEEAPHGRQDHPAGRGRPEGPGAHAACAREEQDREPRGHRA